MALNQMCAAPGCTDLSTPNGEHVLPNWMLRAFTKRVWSPGPYRAESSRTGVERVSEQGVLTKLPCCQNHNGDLSKHFEQRGETAAKRLFGIESSERNASGRTIDWLVHPLEELDALDADETDALARWLVKTMILNGHPRAVREMNGQPMWTDHQPADFPESVFDELFNGRIPTGMNAWLAVSELHADTERHLDAKPRVDLGASLRHPTASVSWGLGLRHGDGGLSLDINVVWAPDAIVVHPDEEAHKATRVWPRPPAQLRVADLPVLDAAAAGQYRSTFYSSGGGFTYKAEWTPVFAERVLTLAITDTESGHDIHWWDFVEDEARITEVNRHLRHTGVLQGNITENGCRTV